MRDNVLGYDFHTNMPSFTIPSRLPLPQRRLLSAVLELCRAHHTLTIGSTTVRFVKLIFPTREISGNCAIAHVVDSRDLDLAVKFIISEELCSRELHVGAQPSDVLACPIDGSLSVRVPGYPDTFHAIVYPFLNGCDSFTFMRRRGKEDGGWLAHVYFAFSVLSGLAQLHRQRIAHCDMKPENIMICFIGGRWCVKIIDFGDATKFDRLPQHLGGSKSYDPPEVKAAREGERVRLTSKRDIFSTGRAMYVVFAGKLPAYDRNGLKRRRGMPDWFGALIERMMAADPEARPTAEQCLQVILDSVGRERVLGECYCDFQDMMERVFRKPDGRTF